MTLYVGLINLDRCDDRLKTVSHQIACAGLVADRIAAVDGAQLTPADLAKYDQRRACRKFRRCLSRGEIGCYLSHIKALKRFLASGADHALVLEDDATFGPELGTLVAQLASVLGPRKDWDVVNLGNCTRRSYSRSVWIAVDGGGHLLCRAHHFPSLTTALFWSRSGAAAFLACGLPVIAPIDQTLKDWCIKTDRGLAFTVAPVTSRKTASEIDALAGNAGRGQRLPGYFVIKQKRHVANWLASLRHRLRHLSGKGPQNHRG